MFEKSTFSWWLNLSFLGIRKKENHVFLFLPFHLLGQSSPFPPFFFWIIIRRDDDVDDVNRCQIFLPLFYPSRWGRKWRRRKKKNQLPGVFGARSTQRRLLNNLKNSFKSVDVCVFFVLLADVARLQSKIKGENNKKNGRKSFNIQRPIFPQSLSLHSSVSTHQLKNKNWLYLIKKKKRKKGGINRSDSTYYANMWLWWRCGFPNFLLLFLFISRRAFFFFFTGVAVLIHTHTQRPHLQSLGWFPIFFFFLVLICETSITNSRSFLVDVMCTVCPFCLRSSVCVPSLRSFDHLWLCHWKGGGFSSGPLLFVVFLAAAYSSSFSSGFFYFIFFFYFWDGLTKK